MAIADTINSIKGHLEDAYGMAQEKGATIPTNKNIQNLSNCISTIEGGTPTPPVDDEWKPQPDWDDISQYDDDIVLLVSDEEPQVNFRFSFGTISSTPYVTVDWGDGTIENVGTGIAVKHIYEKGTGRPCSKGYTTFVIKINKINLSKNMVSLDSMKTDDDIFVSQSWKWLKINFNDLSTINITNNAGITNYYLECVEFPEEMPDMNSLANAFVRLYNLQKLILPKRMPKLTTATNAFQYCRRLKKLHFPEAPILNNLSYAFQYCSELKEVTWESDNYPALTTLTYAFSYCGLDKITMPMMKLTSPTYAFYGSYNLKKVEYTNTNFFQTVSTVAGFFGSNCGIEELDLLDFPTARISTFTNFIVAPFIKKIKMPRANSASSLSTMINSTSALEELYIPPEFGIDKSPTFILTINSTSLRKAEVNCGINFQRIVLSTTARNSLTKLEIPYQKGTYTGAAPQIDVTYSSLSRESILEIFDALPTLSGKTIKVTNSLGASSLTDEDIAIATAKGWTVTK